MTGNSSIVVQTQFVEADGLSIFYRVAGPVNAPTLLLLHGFPTASYQYRTLMPLLAHKYRVIAPDLPGFGFTVVPEARKYEYTFANFGKTVLEFVNTLKIDKFAVYIFDYGAPTAFNLALNLAQQEPSASHRITGIISQNGNAYAEGLGTAWAPIQAYWASNSTQDRDALRPILSMEAIRDSQYLLGVPPALVNSVDPLGWTLDAALIAKPGGAEIQLDLFYDYRNNVASYPKWQAWLRERQPKVLAIWGKHDAFFIPPGAEAWARDVKDAKVILLDTGHFALESHLEEIAQEVLNFLDGVA
ncbi:alpha/beta hydrolase fold protein [Clavulina sp. PMI_390]|nr:alpha/beta hydrolase fold protein [Clavulina sp. PMI_390]